MSKLVLAAISPKVLGPVIVAAFVVILVLAVMSDKKAGRKFLVKIAEEYAPLENFGDIFVTEKKELLLPLASGTLPGYKKWNLAEVAGIKTDSRGNFSFLDADTKVMKGEYLTPSKKKFLKEKAYSNFKVSRDEVESFVQFVGKYAPHIKWYN